ncbi:heparinase II/III family protein [Janthinobacterium sp. SUN120]|uniref:heparinase II/III domain-containing protein n=1 Tax=Janthinobacterium sp. SUN120 TaxID=3004099 RepID=UPI0025B05D2D|nr:heparinase II/III family protein [Janthinobacterium sp. SUN120]MDN2717239.1 heparinase II/III family protein [Janthinobacterium sp. SUN120]
MKFAKYTLVKVALLLVCSACGQAQADWALATDPLAVRTLPDNRQIQPQNPPSFTWSRHPLSPASYVIEVKLAGTVVSTFTSARNWYLPSKKFAAGTYSWRVRPSTSNEWSSPRTFVIDATSKVFEVPESSTLRAAIVLRPRPRGLEDNATFFASWSAAKRADRSQVLTWLSTEVIRNMTAIAPVSDAEWPLSPGKVRTAANEAQNARVISRTNQSARQLEAASLLYRVTGENQYLVEAIARGDQEAALSPNGGTSFVNHDQGNRAIAQSLIKAVDNLGSALDAPRRAAWLEMVRVRTNAMYLDLAAQTGRLDQYPYDSHAASNIGFLTLISTLSLGDIPEAKDWFDFSFRAFVSSYSVWSGPEGGFANGTAYAEYEADYALQIWPALAYATKVDLFTKPWASGFLDYLMHFVPPGSQTHVFGDGHETLPEIRMMKGFAAHFATPAAAWYYKNLIRTDDSLATLQAPYPLPVATVATPAPPGNSAYYPSIGWAAMHSDIGNLQRTSVYFKSSPYGSFNHSHGDQNGFVLASAGVPLLTESGWYDWYDSPLWSSWYRQTKAHNALTFDNGQGQLVDGYETTMARNGRITAFAPKATVDYVAGDATLAYGGQLTSALRKLWFLRTTDAVVVQDQVASATPRVFEWNFHTYAPIVVDAGGAISVTNQGRKVCVVPVSTGARFEKRTGPPPQPGTYEEHGVFIKSAAALSGEFLTVLDVGCKKPLIKLGKSGTARTLTVGKQVVTLPN